MSAFAIVLIVVAALLLILLLGGVVGGRRRRDGAGFDQRITAADQALEQARAADRGWDRELLHEVARRALAEGRPGFEPATLDLVLVDDRPGVEEDRAHLLAAGPHETVRVVLARDASGAWGVERID
jgi:hypothetical protein